MHQIIRKGFLFPEGSLRLHEGPRIKFDGSRFIAILAPYLAHPCVLPEFPMFETL
jgi:hypothetical protein